MNTVNAIYHTTKFWVVIVALSLVLGVLSILMGWVDRSGNLSHRISSLWSRCVCRWNGVEVHLSGLEHLQTDRAQILVANHQSAFDIFALSGFLPIQIRWMAKSSLFNIPFVGWSMRASGYVPVDRSNRKKAYKAFFTTIEKLKSGCSVVLFPEGTRSKDGRIGPFKKGGHLLAVRAKALLVPVTIIGTGQIVKKGSGVIRPGQVRIIISPPVAYGAGDKEETVLEGIRETICNIYEANQF